ncbi:OPRK1 [Branchiostoma lanceolatum]|uniref:OPRK1 protein n=1 Tax=Branchiostoma lanceolatum TaxID=7740 RepID=A0A8J9ZMI0_BRALA|nr:OPRK1 [Branchiostoma lanceolatum]
MDAEPHEHAKVDEAWQRERKGRHPEHSFPSYRVEALNERSIQRNQQQINKSNSSVSDMNFSNELFETDPFAEDFLNESFTTNASGPDVLNKSCTTKASSPVFPPATSPAQPAVIITVAVLAIVGNLLVIAVTTRRRTFPSASRLFIFSMAWSDLILGLTFAFFVAPAGAGEWVYSDTAARACAVIAETSLALSWSALAGLNLDRHYALMNDGAGVSPKKAGIFLVSAWVGIYACNNRQTTPNNSSKTTPNNNPKTTPSNNHKTTPSNNTKTTTAIVRTLRGRVDVDDQQNIQMSSL